MNSSRTPADKQQEEGSADRLEPAAPDLENAQTHVTHEIGGPPGPEPTRYGDWEKGGRCIDF